MWGNIVNIKNRKVAFTLAEGATHVALPKGYRRTAFTLAEVLITIGIIGVVAALTVPHFVQKYVEREIVVKLKQTYSILSNAYNLAQIEYGDSFHWTVEENKTLAEVYYTRISKYLNIVEDCTPKLCKPKIHLESI